MSNTEPAAAPLVMPCAPHDRVAVEELLQSAKLPLAGLDTLQDTILVAKRDGVVIGCVALEIHADGALLRSLAVAPTARGSGLGGELTRAALALARTRQRSRVYLLTETASAFFPRFGFRPVPRDQVAPGVRGSIEFVSACPASAVAMMLQL